MSQKSRKAQVQKSFFPIHRHGVKNVVTYEFVLCGVPEPKLSVS